MLALLDSKQKIDLARCDRLISGARIAGFESRVLNL
jgi:hypothetical protein